MNGLPWIFDPHTQKRHHPDCRILDARPLGSKALCTCPVEDELIEEYQQEQPYRRTPRVPQSDPNRPFQSLASLIREARREGLLRPVQGYIDHSVKVSAP